MNKPFLQRKSYRFKQFARKAYAAFQSLHKEVTIGCLQLYVTNKEMLKAGKKVAITSVLLLGMSTLAEASETELADASPTINEAVTSATPQVVHPDRDSLHDERLYTLSTLNEVLVVAEKAEVQSSAFRLITSVSAEQIQSLPVQTVADILHYLPGIDVRTRGANGSQADVSMRGGTFDQVLIMLNGVNLNDAQTGHYSMNLPIDVSLIERVEILQGTSASLFGLNAFSGAINIITKAPLAADSIANNFNLRLSAGMFGLLNPAFSARIQRGDWYLNTSADYNQANGYDAPKPSEKELKAITNSDYKIANLYLQTGYKGLDLQLGTQYKDAGAGMFYGFGSQDQFDATRTAFASAKYAHRIGAFRLEAAAAYRANYDRYEWHRGQRLYGNFHFSQNTSINLKAHYATRIGTTTLGVELRNENLHSTNLGDTINPNGQVPNVDGFDLSNLKVLQLVKGINRMSINYFAEQTFHYQGLSASLGISGSSHIAAANYAPIINQVAQLGTHVTGGANIGYEYLPQSSVYINANRSLRLPTFTDLYYNAGNQLGNRNLRPEEAWVLSVGTQGVQSFTQAGSLRYSADAYYRWGKNIIDWVFTPDDAKRPYHAQNWNKVNAAGLEASLDYHYNEWLRHIQIMYAYTYLDLDVDKSGSRYLDYLSHKFTARLEHAIYNGTHNKIGAYTFGASWNLTWQKREGQFNNAEGEVCDYQPFLLLDTQLFFDCQHVRIAADCSNLTNRHYYDYGGILQPGAWAKLTITARL